MPLRNIALTDKFFDVWPTSPTRAFVVGDRGKKLLTEDGGRTFKRIDLGTQLGIFGIQMTDDQNGYLCGQDGLIMKTRDSGKTFAHFAEINKSYDPCNCCTTSAAYGADGKLAFLYREETNNERDMFLVLWDQEKNESTRTRVSATLWKTDT